MFNGIIRHLGQVGRMDPTRGKLLIRATRIVRSLVPGDSISVDGVCLTVTRRTRDAFSVDLSRETLRRTAFRWTRPGWIVNLELPMRLKDRIHGHLVLGHVDGVGVVAKKSPLFGVIVPWNLVPYMARKGSVAVNGVSLTIAGRRGRLVQIALIPETLRRTNLRYMRAGNRVNLEVDVLARYVHGKFERE